MDKSRIFFCKPQKAYMSINNCCELRDRPAGRTPAGTQAKLVACEKCELYADVDRNKVPTVSIIEYLDGARPPEPVFSAA